MRGPLIGLASVAVVCRMRNLFHIDGQVTSPESTGHQIIAHVCTDTGIWSGRTAASISRKWPEAKRAYSRWHRYRIRNDFSLGSVQFVNTTSDHVNRIIRVANMIAQANVNRPVSYRALRRCLITVARKAIKIGASVHMSKLTDDQTDSWPDIELIIYNTICTASISMYIYDPKPNRDEQWFGEVIHQSHR